MYLDGGACRNKFVAHKRKTRRGNALEIALAGTNSLIAIQPLLVQCTVVSLLRRTNLDVFPVPGYVREESRIFLLGPVCGVLHP